MTSTDLLSNNGGDDHAPNLENRVAFQWRDGQDTIGYLHATRRDEIVLRWLAEAVKRGTDPRSTFDVGCAYGNYTLMLNARLGCDATVTMHAVDLHEPHLDYGRTFAAQVPGYANCHFERLDIEQRLPFDDATFDAICFADVLEHLESPVEVLRELRRVLKPTGALIVSTPLRTSMFKSAAAFTNRATKGRTYKSYYAGKDAHLDVDGHPIMDVASGHDHISEMTLPELRAAATKAGLRVADYELMNVMSGSRWFDQHPFVMSGVMFIEAIHKVLKRPSWAHAVVLRLER